MHRKQPVRLELHSSLKPKYKLIFLVLSIRSASKSKNNKSRMMSVWGKENRSAYGLAGKPAKQNAIV